MTALLRRSLPLLLVSASASAAFAQAIVCPNVLPNSKLTDCTVPTTNGTATIVVRAVKGTEGLRKQIITLQSPHSNQLPVSVVTDSEGIAIIQWSGNIGTGADTITARTNVEGVGVTARIVVAASSSSNNAIVYIAGTEQYWFQSQQLRHPATVRIEGPTADDCPKTVVAFKAIGDGANSPDTVRGRFFTAVEAEKEQYPQTGCYASTWWKLGTTIGDQHLRASLPSGGTPVSFTAHARALPWLAVGVIMSRLTGFDSVVFDSTANKRVLVGAGHSAVFTPLFAVNFPPYYKWDRIRASIGASVTHPDRDFFAGLSILQLGFGLSNEALGMDGQVGWHFSRQRVPRDADACRTSEKCDTRLSLQGGPGIVIEANGSGLLTNLLTALK